MFSPGLLFCALIVLIFDAVRYLPSYLPGPVEAPRGDTLVISKNLFGHSHANARRVSAIRLSTDERIRRDTDPGCILCSRDAFPALSSRLLFYGAVPFRMKKSVQISRIVSEIHINETHTHTRAHRFSLSGNALPDPMLIPIPPSSVTHKEESHGDSVL